MNIRKIHLFAILTIIIVGSALLISRNTKDQSTVLDNETITTLSTENAQTPITEQSKPINFTANFEIYTNGTKRIFTDPKYHNQSPDVYLTSEDPSIIHVKKPGITWNHFFKTLPFSITKDCLITGTKQTFCTTEIQKLKFFINQTETPNALDLEIKEGDLLKIVYGG